MGSRSKLFKGDIVVMVSALEARLHIPHQLSTERCIYKVPARLRNVSEDAYTPQLVSLGPLHYGSKELQQMETHKSQYLRNFLTHEPQKNIEYYVQNLGGYEKKARQCYGASISLTSEKFVQMMIIDGCFMIDFMLKSCGVEFSDINDFIFSTAWMEGAIVEDMQLIENQLPFFVIEHLFNLNSSSNRRFHGCSFLELTVRFFQQHGMMAPDNFVKYSECDIKHFVDLLRKCYVPSSPRMVSKNNERIQLIPSATELHEAGVKFEKGSSTCFLDISFTKTGLVIIPQLRIVDSTEVLFRNLAAFEQFDLDNKYISDYVLLMDMLINTPSDVALL